MIAFALAGGAAAPDEAPSLELLLHLAEFADADGRPIDPQGVAEAMEITEPGAAMPGEARAAGTAGAASTGATAAKPRARGASRPPEDDDED